MIAISLLLLSTFASPYPALKTPAQATRFLEQNGYKLSFDSGSTSGILSVNRDRVAASFGESFEYGKTYRKPLHTWVSLYVESSFLLPHPIDRNHVESWFKALNLGPCKLIARVDDVVTLKDEGIDFNGKTDVLGRLAGFYKVYRGLKNQFRGDQRWNTQDIGRLPADNVRLYALSFGELQTMGRSWGWTIYPGISDFGMHADMDVSGTRLDFSMGYDQTDWFTLCAYIPVAKGASPSAIARRLQANLPAPWSAESKALLDSGKPVHSFDAGDTSGNYCATLNLKFKGMTVAEFRDCIMDFAAKVKALPRK